MDTITEQKETSALAQLRAKLGQKAKLEPKFRFYTLYHHICRDDVLYEAWRKVKRNRGSAGIDGISIKCIEQSNTGVLGFLKEIQGELKSRTYYPKPVKRVYIPKSNGKLRPLGIPTVKDRVVQAAVLLIIEPIFEQDFLECSYGFRPNKSAHQAINNIKSCIAKGQQQIYDADLKGYFDTIPHDQLMKALEMRIVDRKVLKLIRKWLEAPIWERGKPMKKNDKGTPQGGIISPLLANIYMHWFDKVFYGPSGPGTWAKASLVRYADDFVILAKYMTRRVQSWIEDKTEHWLKLSINREKTKVVDLAKKGSHLDFLGFTIRRANLKKRPGVKFNLVTPSKGSIKNAKEKVKELTSSKRGFRSIPLVVNDLNMFLRGWGQYFSNGHSSDAYQEINGYVQRRLYRFLKRRSQRGYKKRDVERTWYQHFKKMGLLQLTKQHFRMNAYG